MRIAYFGGSRIPSRVASSVHVMKMCQALSQCGHAVTLFSPRSDAIEAGVADPFAFYGVRQTFGHEILSFPTHRWGGYVYAVAGARRAREMRADLVYARFLPGAVAAAALGLPVVYEAHAPPQTRAQAWLLRILVGRPRFKGLVAISAELARLLELALGGRIHSIVAHDAADDVDEESQATGEPIASTQGADPSTAFTVGYVGHLYQGRGIELLVALAARCPWATFNLVGGTPADIERWQASHGSLANLHFRGFVPPAVAGLWMRRSSALVAPYQRDVKVAGGRLDTTAWMSPLKIFEYMASGRPIVCSRLPALAEVLEHEQHALMCEPDNVSEWQRALERLRDNPGLATRLGTAARDRFRQNHTWLGRAQGILSQVAPRLA